MYVNLTALISDFGHVVNNYINVTESNLVRSQKWLLCKRNSDIGPMFSSLSKELLTTYCILMGFLAVWHRYIDIKKVTQSCIWKAGGEKHIKAYFTCKWLVEWLIWVLYCNTIVWRFQLSDACFITDSRWLKFISQSWASYHIKSQTYYIGFLLLLLGIHFKTNCLLKGFLMYFLCYVRFQLIHKPATTNGKKKTKSCHFLQFIALLLSIYCCIMLHGQSVFTD